MQYLLILEPQKISFRKTKMFFHAKLVTQKHFSPPLKA